LKVREATPVDASATAELLGQLGYAMSTAEAGERLGRRDNRVLLAESEGRAVGLLAYTVHRPIEHARPVARVTAMIVRDLARRRGVGRHLMERAATLAEAEGCEGIELTSAIRPERADAHRFYEALGYERTSYRFWRSL
jgi:GNAT superfamily N-acetyltransferase